jgi:hypothetical protein
MALDHRFFTEEEQRNIIALYKEAHQGINDTIRCIVPAEAFSGTQGNPNKKHLVVNTDPATYMPGEKIVFALQEVATDTMIGTFGFVGIVEVPGGGPPDPNNFRAEVIPSPGFVPAGAHIWHEANTQDWARSITDTIDHLLEIKLPREDGTTLQIVRWKIPGRVATNGAYSWNDDFAGGQGNYWARDEYPSMQITPRGQDMIFRRAGGP